MTFPLPTADLASLGFHEPAIDRVVALIERHIAEGRYPGAQIALARHGKLALYRSFGDASIEPRRPAGPDTLWLLFSNTKVVTAAAVWLLVERGLLRFSDRIAAVVPEFARHGKGDITVHQLLSHQAGFPNATVPAEAWEDHAALRRVVSDFTLEWTPGSKVVYHPAAAHWVAAVLIEALSGRDFRRFIRDEIAVPLGLADELQVGLGEEARARAATIYEPDGKGGQAALADRNTAAAMRAGIPGGGGYATARAMAAFYQMLAAGGRLAGVRLLSPRMVQFVTRPVTGDRVDEYMGMPMHRGLGPHMRGLTPAIRGLGTIAHPGTFGHGGVGSSYCWADPDSGVSFAYLSNSRVPDPWHSERLDAVATMVHAAIDL